MPEQMQPLSGLDALFLQLESPEMPMHVGSLSLLELPSGYRGDFAADVRRLIAARLHLAPAFRRKLVTMPLGLANPAWLRTRDVDLAHHIRRVTLPRPGTMAQLEACVGRLHSQLLDRDRPLWQLVVIDGLGGELAGHVGYYAKVHHAAIDGQAGVALAQAMLDVTPVPREVPPPPEEPAVDEPGTLARLALATRQTAKQWRQLASLVPTAADLIGAGLRNARGDASSAPANRAPADPRNRTPLIGPRTALNVTISRRRAFSSASLPLAEVKHTARALGVSLNDVVLATCSGALRRWLMRHGGVPRQPLAAGVPFSVRAQGDARASNQVSMMRAGLATHLADPAARLMQIHASMQVGKAVTGRMRSLVPTDYPSLGSAWLVSGIAWLAGAIGQRLPAGTHLPSLAPVAISNVPGPPQTLYVAGARVVHYWPASIVVHGVALNITVQSYAQWLDIGLTACRAAVPDLPTFRQHLAAAFDELQALAAHVPPASVNADADMAPKPARRKSLAAAATNPRQAPAKVRSRKAPAAATAAAARTRVQRKPAIGKTAQARSATSDPTQRGKVSRLPGSTTSSAAAPRRARSRT
jgi:diacylglycerol O-acyltransferase / wax synthase